MKIEFEWDERKNAVNIKKHGVSFEEAALVFNDPCRYERYDKIHSFLEKRWIIVGFAGWKVLRVIITERYNTIRIITARKADKNDEKRYFYGYSKTDN
jgi:hypothetical protein